MSNIRLIKQQCRGGCGKTIHSVNRSIYGMDSLYRQYVGYCADCMPISEQKLMLMMAHGITGGLKP